MTKTLPQSTQLGFTGSSTTSRSGETDTELAGTDEHSGPDPPQRRATTSGSSQRRPVSELVANMQQLVNEGSAASDAQNAHKRERKHTGSEKSGERVTKPAPPDKSKTHTRSTQSRVTAVRAAALVYNRRQANKGSALDNLVPTIRAGHFTAKVYRLL